MTASLYKDRIKVRCTQCHARLCDRVLTQEGWLLHFKKGRSWLFTTQFTLYCEKCGTVHLIENAKGIVQSYRNEYYEQGIQTENTAVATADSR